MYSKAKALNTNHIYTLDENGVYEETGIYKGKEIAESSIFKGLTINFANIF